MDVNRVELDPARDFGIGQRVLRGPGMCSPIRWRGRRTDRQHVVIYWGC